MGIATILAVLAFLISLLALWLTSDIVKKVEGQNEKFVRGHISTLREEMREMDKSLNKTAKLVKGQSDVQAGLDSRIGEREKTLEGLHAQLTEVRAQLGQLDRSIPARFRVKGEAEPDVKAKPKKVS